MSLSFCVLGSGSAGNSTLVICGRGRNRRCLLIDCGLSPRATAKRMAALGTTLDDIAAILLTHFDTDHFYPGWLKLIELRSLPVHLHKSHRNAAWRAGLTARHASLFQDQCSILDSIHARAMLLAHDDLGSVSYVIEHDGKRLGYATDVGHIPHSTFDHFAGIHALAIESNYDRQMQLDSGRPVFLKRRIMGGRGHLSNAQSLEAVLRIGRLSTLSHIALLHLSRECNDPALVRDLYASHAPRLLPRLTVTCQFEPTPLLAVRRLKPPTMSKSGRSATAALVIEPHLDLPLFAGHMSGT